MQPLYWSCSFIVEFTLKRDGYTVEANKMNIFCINHLMKKEELRQC